MKIQSIKKIATDGRHNAFTGLAFFKGRYFLVFRTGAHHADGAKGTQLLFTSTDGEDWELLQNKAFFEQGNTGDQMDYRDSYFLNLGHELRLYSFPRPSMHRANLTQENRNRLSRSRAMEPPGTSQSLSAKGPFSGSRFSMNHNSGVLGIDACRIRDLW